MNISPTDVAENDYQIGNYTCFEQYYQYTQNTTFHALIGTTVITLFKYSGIRQQYKMGSGSTLHPDEEYHCHPSELHISALETSKQSSFVQISLLSSPVAQLT
jgi:hypothetical protein